MTRRTRRRSSSQKRPLSTARKIALVIGVLFLLLSARFVQVYMRASKLTLSTP
jgi:hypothetical protein